ncbi:MAG: LysM peptidoglycan-binding domain-containing protein [Myxococcales bacterium]|nr:LysM peptidoglycan-binding domain-containing protein [Myxococcales bacterium]
MISALAFGYGVGMATPEATIASVRTSVDGLAPRPSHTAARVPMPRDAASNAVDGGHAYGGYGALGDASLPTARTNRGSTSGVSRESSQLSRLRERSDGASCKLGGPRDDEESFMSRADARGDERREFTSGDDLGVELDAQGRSALSRLQLPDFKVAVTRSALTYVRFLTRTTQGRDMFETWLKRSGRYQDMVQEQLREWHLPEDLIWVAMIESGFDPRAKSPAGAVGLWQFMRATGGVYGLSVNRYSDDRKNPVVATRAAAHHLRDLYQRFGAWDLAFAAYNMGYEQLLSAIDRAGTSDFNELAMRRAIPSETANYVPKIVAAALVSNNLELYGFGDVKGYRPMSSAELSVPGGVSIATVAKAAGINGNALRSFNPHLLGQFLPPGPETTVYVPAESLSRARAALPAMLNTADRVTDGDVLAPTDLAGLSGARDVDRVHGWGDGEDSLLSLLPKPKRRHLRSLLGGRGDAASRDDEPLGAMADEFGPRRSDRETVMYRVSPGDTMIGVAKQFAVDVDDLARDNGLDAEDRLREGALLRLMVKRAVVERWQRSASGTADGAGGSKPKHARGADAETAIESSDTEG